MSIPHGMFSLMDAMFTLRDFADKVGVTYRTVLRWWAVGAMSETGKRIKLQTDQGPSGRITCQRYYEEFIAALNDDTENE